MNLNRRTKIVATLGPATSEKEMIKKLIEQGVNVFRLNFSHGTHEAHQEIINRIKELRKQLNVPVAILQDVQGPAIRIGDVEGGKATIETGSTFKIFKDTCLASSVQASVSYPYLIEDVPVGAKILFDDGKIDMDVIDKTEDALVCKVVFGGVISPRKSVVFPDIALRINALTEKDYKDIKFGSTQDVDFLAVSFVQRASDILEAKDYLEKCSVKTPVIAKIETREALNNIESIIAVTDGVMVARGDLGVSIPPEEVPLAQKQIISLCNRAGKPVITATQMLDSMVNNPRPTRAEASDVANAIVDGTDAVMLSDETAVGKHPLKAISTMHNIALAVEKDLSNLLDRRRQGRGTAQSISQAIALSSCQMADSLSARAIVTATESGKTARQVSRHRPNVQIIAATAKEKTRITLNLLWGVYPLLIPQTNNTDELMKTILDLSLENQLVSNGDTLIMIAGSPVGQAGTTNTIKVETVTQIIGKTIGIGHKVVSSRAIIARNAQEACEKVEVGDILVVRQTDRDFMPALEKAAAIITEIGGLTSHAAIVAMSLGIPVMLGLPEALTLIEDQQQITVDPIQDLVFSGTPNMT